MREKVVVETESGRVIRRVLGKRGGKLPSVSGEAIKSTTHTHPLSQVALPSEKDLYTFASNPGNHSILGDKWPMARRVAAQLGTELPRAVVKTTITHAQAEVALEAIRIGRELWENQMKVLVDVTDHMMGKAP